MWKEVSLYSLAALGGLSLAKFVLERMRAGEKNLPSSLVQEVMFFPEKGIACPNFDSCNDQRCRFSHENTSLRSLVQHIRSAKSSIDVCVFVLTCRELAVALIEVSKSGTPVRVVTDREMAGATGSQVSELRAKGVPVRVHSSPYLMHHKFAVIDKRLLIIGSFNWTRQAVTGNHESLILTSEDSFIQPFLHEFSRLWDEFDPIKK